MGDGEKEKEKEKEKETVESIADEIKELTDKMFDEGLLDDQFAQLQQLQDESNPEFVEEVVSLYFEDSGSKIESLEEILAKDDPDFTELDGTVHQFKGSSASIGAAAIAKSCVSFRGFCQSRDRDGCKKILDEITEKYDKFKTNLEKVMKLEARKRELEEGGEDE